MNEMNNKNVEIQATEIADVEVKEGFFAKAGHWVAKHKKGIAIAAVAGTALAFVVGAFVKKANEDETDEVECEEDVFDADFEIVETEE